MAAPRVPLRRGGVLDGDDESGGGECGAGGVSGPNVSAPEPRLARRRSGNRDSPGAGAPRLTSFGLSFLGLVMRLRRTYCAPGGGISQVGSSGHWLRRDFNVTLSAMASHTGAERYFETRAAGSPEYRAALEGARSRIAAVDSVVRALDERRRVLGLSKAELARQAGMRPEVVRRLLGAGGANPTLATVISLARVMSLDVTISGPGPADTPSGASGTRRRIA